MVEFSNQLAESGKVVIVAALDGTFQKQVRYFCNCTLHLFQLDLVKKKSLDI